MRRVDVNLRVAIEATLFVLIGWSVLSYFDALSQYATMDQNTTHGRIVRFLQTGDNPFADNAKFTNLFVGVPGIAFKKLLDCFFVFQDHLIGNVYYTPYLPYAFFSVLWALVMIVACAYLLARIHGVDPRKDRVLCGVILLVLLNIPIVKATSKVLKYDALALLLSSVAVLSYLDWKETGKKTAYWIFLCLSATAFYEKMTMLVPFACAIALECLKISLEEKNNGKFLRRISQFALHIVYAFLALEVILMPKILLTPLQIFTNFFSVFDHASLPRSTLIFLFVIAAAVIVVRKWVHAISLKIENFLPMLCFAILAGSTIFAALYQTNDIFIFDHLPAADAERVHRESLYVGPMVLDTRLTTLDPSRTVTHLKIFLAWLRVSVYGLPLAVLLVLLTQTIARRKRKGFAEFLMGLAFSWGVAYAALCFPFDVRYNAGTTYCLALAALCLFIPLYRSQNDIRKTTLAMLGLILIGLLIPASRPSYFRYFNFLRSRAQEKADDAFVGKHAWTFYGWGESSYSLFQYLGSKMGRTFRVGFDYIPPFQLPKNITPVHCCPVRCSA